MIIENVRSQPIDLEHLVYTWAERTLTGSGHGVVLRSAGWPTTNDIVSDGALAGLLEYIPSKFIHRLADGRVPPAGVDFWEDPVLGHVVAIRRYLGKDSSGRPGRSIVHVLLDKGRNLTARTAFALAQSEHIVRDWSFTKPPIRQAAPVTYQPSPSIRPSAEVDDTLVYRVLGGILEILGQRRNIVFTQSVETDTVAILGVALAALPEELTKYLTFSTYRGVPIRSNCALSFASASFSDPRPVNDAERLYIPLQASSRSADQGASGSEEQVLDDNSYRLASKVISFRNGRESEYPPGINSIERLDEWLEFHKLISRPTSTLSLADCKSILRLPGDIPMVDRNSIIDRIADLIAVSSTALDDPRPVLTLLNSSERSKLEDSIHSMILNGLEEAPTEAGRLRKRASLMGFSEGGLAKRAAPALTRIAVRNERPLDPELEEFIKKIAEHVPEEQIISWAENVAFHPSVLDRWEPIAQAIAMRTWSEETWMSAHPVAAGAVAKRFHTESTQLLTELLYSGRPVSRTIIHLLHQEGSLRTTVYSDILLTAASSPRVTASRLLTLTDQREIPIRVRNLIEVLAYEKRPMDRITPTGQQTTRPRSQTGLSHDLPQGPQPRGQDSDSAHDVHIPAMGEQYFAGNRAETPTGPTARDSVPFATTSSGSRDSMELDTHAPHSEFKISVASQTRKRSSYKTRHILANSLQTLLIFLAAGLGYLAGSTDGSVLVWVVALLGILVIAAAPALWRMLFVRCLNEKGQPRWSQRPRSSP